MRHTRIGLLAAVAALAAGCIDTALSLVVDVRGGEASMEAETLSVQIDADVRVGRFALSGDNFILPEADVFVGETPIAEVVLMRPEGFTGRLEPGESASFRLQGTAMLGSRPAAISALCGASEATVLLQWVAEEQADDPLDPPIRSMGSAEGTLSVRCP